MKNHFILLVLALLAGGRVNGFGQTNAPIRMPEVVVAGESLQEDRLVGHNEQPEWTTQRRFATTRIYVLEPWQVEFEQWGKG